MQDRGHIPCRDDYGGHILLVLPVVYPGKRASAKTFLMMGHSEPLSRCTAVKFRQLSAHAVAVVRPIASPRRRRLDLLFVDRVLHSR